MHHNSIEHRFIELYGCDSFDYVQRQINSGISKERAYAEMQAHINTIYQDMLREKGITRKKRKRE